MDLKFFIFIFKHIMQLYNFHLKMCVYKLWYLKPVQM